MPRKPMSAAEKKAASDRMKNMHSKRKEQAEAEKRQASSMENLDQLAQQPAAPEVPKESPDLYNLVLRLMQEVEDLKKGTVIDPNKAIETLAKSNGLDVGPNGVQGIKYRYPVEKSYYPDPTDRLYDDPALKRFAMRENFIFKWDVQGETYEKYNITFSEPRFVVELFRRIFDDEGIDTGKAILVGRQFQMEDDLTTKIVADRLGLTNTFGTFRELMDEIRFLRIRTWLIGLFTPAKIERHKKRPMTTIIDGKVVEMYDTEELTDSGTAAEQAATIRREALPSQLA